MSRFEIRTSTTQENQEDTPNDSEVGVIEPTKSKGLSREAT
jgi:hypothetical protein